MVVVSLQVLVLGGAFSNAFDQRGRLRFFRSVAEVETASPLNLEICFSPKERCDLKLIKFLQNANVSLDIAIFDLTLDQIAHEILVLSKKIPVRVLADRRQGNGPHSLIRTLIKGGVAVKFGKQRGVMHNKFTLVDSKMIETGSFNYTGNATNNNNENQIYLSDPVVVEHYKAHFEEIWNEGVSPKVISGVAGME